MSHFRLNAVLCTVLCTVSVQLSAQPSYENYHLVWSDEFSTNGLPDAANWGYEEGCSIRNSELQYYARARNENSRVEDGFLIIEARRESMNGCDYTAASLITRRKHEFRYGIFEMRAKIDVRQGSWPAFWTLGISEEWPSNGEVDIMEYYTGNLHANVAWGTDTRWEAEWDSELRSVNSAFSDDFHIWRMHWTEEFIDLWVDDVKQNTTDLRTTINGSLATLRNPFHQNAYILVNQAIGSNGGDPSGTAFPIRYIIDYVRVYQENPITTTAPPATAGQFRSLPHPPLRVSITALDGQLIAKKTFSSSDCPKDLAQLNRAIAGNRTPSSGILVISITNSAGTRVRYLLPAGMR